MIDLLLLAPIIPAVRLLQKRKNGDYRHSSEESCDYSSSSSSSYTCSSPMALSPTPHGCEGSTCSHSDNGDSHSDNGDDYVSQYVVKHKKSRLVSWRSIRWHRESKKYKTMSCDETSTIFNNNDSSRSNSNSNNNNNDEAYLSFSTSRSSYHHMDDDEGDDDDDDDDMFSFHTSCDEFTHVTIQNLLGCKVDEDEEIHELPNDLVRPENLENCMEVDLPVGYYRLRRALLNSKNDFWDDLVLSETLKYSRITSTGWDRHEDVIGQPTLPSNIQPSDIIGTTKTTEFLMPKTTLVRANMAYETTTITEYNNNCFAIEMNTTNPDVPYGKQFMAHTKIVVYNTGRNTCQMVCSVETIFPNGPPLGVGWQIKNAMKNGSMSVFEKIGCSIREYAIHDDGGF